MRSGWWILALLPLVQSCAHTQAHYDGECIVEDVTFAGLRLWDSTICDLPRGTSSRGVEHKDEKFKRNIEKMTDEVNDIFTNEDEDEIEGEDEDDGR